MQVLNSEISREEQEFIPEIVLLFNILVIIEINRSDLKLLVCVFCIITEYHFLDIMANNYVIYVE
jgi:hypothetical protein